MTTLSGSQTGPKNKGQRRLNELDTGARRTFMSDTWRSLRRDRAGLIGLVAIALLALSALAAPLLAPHDPNYGYREGLDDRGFPLPPFSQGPPDQASFYLGTDGLGRDLLSRILHGARISLMIGIVANTMSMAIGLTAGMIGGYFRGFIGQFVMRLTDMVMAIPTLILAMALITILQPGLLVVIIVIALAYWTYLARIVYGEVRSIRNKEFVEAAVCVGATHSRVVFRHILPNLISIAIVYATLSAATMILTEATLSFLGIGVRPPTPSWGGMLSEGQQFFLSSPWLMIFPGIALLLTLLAFNLLGDALRDALDPRSVTGR
jgi:peptide/nickel transport system permease protein